MSKSRDFAQRWAGSGHALRGRARAAREIAARPDRSGRAVVFLAAVLLTGAVLLVGACDGDSLFNSGPGGPDETPPTIEIIQPSQNGTVPVGDSILVEVDLMDDVGVASVEIRGVAVRGGQEVLRFEPRSRTFDPTARLAGHSAFLISTPDVTKEPVLIIATATDAAGNTASDTVEIFVGGPRVEIRLPVQDQQLLVGGTTRVQILAVDSAGLSAIWLLSIFDTDTTRIDVTGISGDSVLETVTLSPLPTGVGTLTLEAWAQSSLGITGKDVITVELVTEPAVDDVRPTVRRTVGAGERMEMTDSIVVDVVASDNLAVVSIGLTLIGIRGTSPDTIVVDTVVDYANPLTGSVGETFSYLLGDLYAGIGPTLPDSITFEAHAYAFDTESNCGASVLPQDQQLPCTTRQIEGGTYTVAAGSGQESDVVVVDGRTILLPAGGMVADGVVDLARRYLYLSSIDHNRVEVLDLSDTTFIQPGIAVGSRPWGLFMNGAGDTLIVANSGGDNISFVALDVMREHTARRLRTPNIVLFQINLSEDDIGRKVYTMPNPIGFSDRPQFVVQDATGRLLYSTEPTSVAREGTIRKVVTDAAWQQPEVELLFYPTVTNEDAVAIARVDSIKVVKRTADGFPEDHVIIWDHQPGFPNIILQSPETTVIDACDQLLLAGSDVLCGTGAWDLPGISMSDTTYLAASGDRNIVAFGEGAMAPVGRIVLWDAVNETVSSDLAVADLVDNAAERVLGIGLNVDGTLGVARGEAGAYFFTQDLRFPGEFKDAGGAGAVLHPQHPSYATTPPSDLTTLAFVGTTDATIKIVDTVHFLERGEIAIRDNISGPLRASPPFAGENGGLTPSDPDYLIGRVYGVTAAGGVVIVEIRRRHVQDIQ